MQIQSDMTECTLLFPSLSLTHTYTDTHKKTQIQTQTPTMPENKVEWFITEWRQQQWQQQQQQQTKAKDEMEKINNKLLRS